MNTLPDDAGKSTIPTTTGTIGIGKESEGITISDSEQGLHAAGAEIELPKEVSAIGVTQQPTVVQIPQPVSQLGVKPTGINIPIQASPSVATPLSDSELAKGLHISVMNSFRWLAEWCKKQLMIFGIKSKV
ncbi:MAG: hypothetical protein UU25_C0013G0002 [Microgenomates group bacterium GW2011_GWB1_40_9]|nr:MAG: hypothetical protein UT26_C0027G0002 [Microgenomates group bacterium GW2011_GWC1_39_12]KKR79465.1 MAG: hypothetical protein UU25_C0013G0002 [Microgenomates group bacterium GW2011_GWB1_40_9]